MIKCKNKIDQRIYAIKKIILPSKITESQEKKILREVNLLSRLHHHNVVRYYSAWREDNDVTVNDDIMYDDMMYDDEEEEDLSWIEETEKTMKPEHKGNRVMYIQMEYCDGTLRDVSVLYF